MESDHKYYCPFHGFQSLTHQRPAEGFDCKVAAGYLLHRGDGGREQRFFGRREVGQGWLMRLKGSAKAFTNSPAPSRKGSPQSERLSKINGDSYRVKCATRWV